MCPDTPEGNVLMFDFFLIFLILAYYLHLDFILSPKGTYDPRSTDASTVYPLPTHGEENSDRAIKCASTVIIKGLCFLTCGPQKQSWGSADLSNDF